MHRNDIPPFSKFLIGLGELYGKTISESLFEIYWRALERFDFPAVKGALEAHINNPDAGQFFPKPADVLRYIEGETQIRAFQAWARVRKTIQRIGHNTTVIFDDPIIHAVIADMGGWQYLCKMLEKEVPFKAAEFEKKYAAYVLHPPKNYPKQLTGLYEIEPPTFIGDTQKALLVYQSGNDCELNFHKLSAPINPLSKQLETNKNIDVFFNGEQKITKKNINNGIQIEK